MYEEGDLATALDLLAATGALAETRNQARRHADRAIAALEVFSDGPVRRAMSGVADFVVTRQS